MLGKGNDMVLKANYHTHTTWCDGSSTPREIVEEALRLGFAHLGFSGHMDADIHMDMDRYAGEIRKLQAEYGDRLEILCGVEWDNLYDTACTEGMDFVIGSTHFMDVRYERPLSIDYTPEDVVLLCREFYGGDYLKLCRDYYALEATIADKYPCTFIGHFDLVTKYNHLLHFVDEDDPRYLKPAYEAMEYLAGKGIPFEINTRQAHRGKFFPGETLLKRLFSLGGEIVINSDAHGAGELDKGFEAAAELAKSCGFRHTNYLTKMNGKPEWIQVGLQ